MNPVPRRVSLKTGLSYHLLEWPGPAGCEHTVLLLHGFLDLAWSWQKTAEMLAREFHVVAPDMRGHGDSDRVGAGGFYYFSDYLADLHDLIPQVSRSRLSIVGHSMGGSIAAYYTGTYPDSVHKLAILEGLGPLETTTLGPERMREFISSWSRALDRPERCYPTVEMAAKRLQAGDPLLSTELAIELAGHGTTMTPRGLRFKHDPLHHAVSPNGFEVAVAQKFWRQVTCPVLHVEGAESDFLRTLSAEEIARRRDTFAHSTTVTLAGAGHMMQRHQPAALANALLTFLRA